MSKIPTAEEFLKDNLSNPNKGWSEKKRLIEFAKLHVKEALKQASKVGKVETILNCTDHTPYYGAYVTCGETANYERPTNSINKDSILNAYPEENIK